MKLKGFVKKASLLLIILSVAWSIALGQEKNQITGFAGLNYILQYGSAEDYVLGENDFPVTPAHAISTLGFSYARFFSGSMAVEVDFRYNLSTKVNLEDPSDGDRAEVEIAKHYTITGNILYQLTTGDFVPYVTAGAGVDMLSGAEDQTIISELGYEVTLEAPAKKNDFVVNAGAGINYFINPTFGIRFDARYLIILKTDDHPLINSFNVVGGIVYKF
jgi:hypothetical protein